MGAQSLEVASVFQDGVILQRNSELPVWGWAEPGESILVELGEIRKEALSDEDGRWQVLFAPMEANKSPIEMRIKSSTEELEVRNILVGDVWLCSGQSNMQWSVRQSNNGPREIAQARNPTIRQFSIERKASDTPSNKVEGRWIEAVGPQTGQFSAVGYYFAKELQNELDVPIGLLRAAVGGTMIESWLPHELIETLGERRVPPSRPQPQQAVFDKPSCLFNGMIHPLVPLPIKGILWYQGERNARFHEEYRESFPLLIDSWREYFNNPDLPFYFVQLPNFAAREGPHLQSWAWMREAQLEALQIPGTGMAVTIDIGDPSDIHPGNKQDVGLRLALLALNRSYGKEHQDGGPVFARAYPNDEDPSRLRVEFDQSHPAPYPIDNIARAFVLAGVDRNFLPAEDAVLEGHSLLLHSSAIHKPMFVRYAWDNDPEVTIFSECGLPASPFRNDDFSAP